MDWYENETRDVKLGTIRKRKNKASHYTTWSPKSVPAPYDRIVSQLIAEDMYGSIDSSHEAYRRQSYARAVLQVFGKELSTWKGDPKDFRSKALTPILQRQLWGVPESYTPSVRTAVADGDGKPTILDATKFYLSEDPAHPGHIPTYRRNILYIPQARWHLGLVMKKNIIIGEEDHYAMVMRNHDRIMGALKEQEEDDPEDVDESGCAEEEMPLLTRTEVEVIVEEMLEDFFLSDLERVVYWLLSPFSHDV